MSIRITEHFEPIINKQYRNYLYYGGRGGSKSASIARALLSLAGTQSLRVLCTREIQKSIKDSVHKLLKDIIYEYKLEHIFNVQRESITSITGSEFIFEGLRSNIQEVKGKEGIDICWVEEAQSVSKESLDVLVPTVRKQGSFIIYSFNRLRELDPVWQKFGIKPAPDTFVCKLTFRDNPFISQTLLNEMERDKLNNYEDYLHIWEGEPVTQSDKAILSRIDIQDAINRTVDDMGQIIIGVDVARFGSDKSQLYKRKGFKVIDHREYYHADTHALAGHIADFVNQDKTVLIKIDATGVGGGTCDTLRAWGYNVYDINFGASPKDKDKYNNLISEAWFNLKDLITQIEIPSDDELKNELATREWHIDNRGRRCVESKDDYKKRGYQSPDKADALIICFYSPNDYTEFKRFDLTGGLTRPSVGNR